MTEDKRIVWTNIDLDSEDWYDDLREQFPYLDENALYEKMWSLNNEYLDDERANLDLYVGSPILVLADLGLWNGRHRGHGEIKSGNLMDCLKTDCEYAEWYVDKDGEFASRRIHHDGTNYYRYRRYLPDTTEDEIEDLKEKLYDGTATEDDINGVTEPLGSLVEAVCGWEPSYLAFFNSSNTRSYCCVLQKQMALLIELYCRVL